MRGSLSPLRFALATASLAALLTPLLHAQDDPPPQAGRLSYISGNVSIQPAGAQDWGQAYPNFPVGPGDRIFTDDNSRAEIQVGRSYVRIGPDSDVTFVNYDFNAVTFGIAQGALHVRTRGLWDQQSLYVQTPSGTSTVTGPADFRVDVIPSDQVAIFTTYDGDQYLSGAGGFGADTPRGQSIELIGTNPVYPQWLQPAGADDLDQWSQQRDQQIFRSASFRYVSEDVPGAWDLDASGQWTPGTEYGNIWFPNVQAGWAPYHNGHWVDHEPWGFVWVEDESWGYAPFHYGRWVNYHNRWGWIPGPLQSRPVWSPALVAFAGGISIGGGGVSVWFPLGPGEPYRPWYPCSSRYIDQVNIANIQPAPQVRVEKTYVNIVNVTNVTNVTNITYVNRSIGATAMRQQDMAAGRPVAQAAVHVDAQQLQHAQVIARPQVVPTRASIIARPPARPVPVAAARPVLINAKGQAVAAQPKAQPAPPPVRQAPAPRPLPGRAVVAPPPNVKMTPAARQAVQSHPPAQQQPQPNRPVQPANAAQPGRPAAPPPAQPGRPVATPPAQPARPNQPPPQQTQPKPNPVPATHPPAQPAPATRPAPAEPTPQHPAPQENHPVNRPPQPPPAQPQRPAERPPAPAQPQRTPPAEPQRTPPPPTQRPAPPENRPAERPATPPPSRPAPPPARTQPEARPNQQPEAKPAPRQTPPPEKKKPEDKKPEEEKKPEL